MLGRCRVERKLRDSEVTVLPLQVISAIGSIGSADDEKGNGATNEAAVAAASRAGVKRFVLVSASKDRRRRRKQR